MDPQQAPDEAGTVAGGNLEPAHAAQPAWTVKFIVPAPDTMPSDRMKARAELVRSAGGCEMCGGCY